MEIQTSKALSDVQQFRYELLQGCGNVEDAEKANTFVMGKDEKPVQAQLPKSGNMEDGIYLVHTIFRRVVPYLYKQKGYQCSFGVCQGR